MASPLPGSRCSFRFCGSAHAAGVTRDGRSRSGWASLGLHHAGFRGWPLAILVPLVVLGAAYGIVWATGFASYNDPGMDAAGWASGLGQGIVGNLVFATLTFSLAEEMAGAATCSPSLCRAGAVPAMALTGLMHGAFHLPLILLTSFYHPDGNRLIVIPLFLAAFTVGGLLYGYLRLTYNSTWPEPGALDPQLPLGAFRQPDRRDVARGGGVPGRRERHPHHHRLRHCRGVAVAGLRCEDR